MADWSIHPDDPDPAGGQTQPVKFRRAGSPYVAGLLVLVLAIVVGGYVIDRLSAPQPAALPTPIPTATVAAPIALFRALVGDPNLAFHEESVATVRDGADSATMTVRSDQSGPAAAIRVSVRSTLPSVRSGTQQMVIKDGVNYLKVGDEAWTRTPGGQATAIFASMRVDQIEYVGPEIHDGGLLNHLRVPFDSSGTRNCPPSVVLMDLWVRDDGVPVSGSAELQCSVVVGIQGTTSFANAFSKVGEPITIEVPAQFR